MSGSVSEYKDYSVSEYKDYSVSEYKLIIFYKITLRAIHSKAKLIDEFANRIYSIEMYLKDIEDLKNYKSCDNLIKYIKYMLPLLDIVYIDIYECCNVDVPAGYKNKLKYLLRINIPST